MTPETIRLNKHIALQFGVSRREADELIAAGHVKVNNETAELGRRVFPSDVISVKGKPVQTGAALMYIAFHKPAGYVCSRRQQGDIPTIYSILPAEFRHLKPVGRLDKDSSGLLLLTNDGDFAHTMTHPSFHKTKAYEVTLRQELEPLHQQMISDFGVQLDDGPSKLQLTRLNNHSRRDWQVSMHEGRNRQIRRTFGGLGYEVLKLHRTAFGNYQLNNLPVGNWQEIHVK